MPAPPDAVNSISLQDENAFRRFSAHDASLTACVAIGSCPASILDKLCESLSGNPFVNLVDLGNNELKDAGAIILAKWLQGSDPGLVELILDSTAISPVGWQRIGRALAVAASTPSLRVVKFFNNAIGDMGAAALVSAFARLTHVYFANGEIGDAGARAIATALKAPHALRLLDLSFNAIGDVGAVELGSSLPFSDTLTELFLGNNEIRAVGLVGLAKGLESCHSILALRLEKNPVQRIKLSDEQKSAVQKSLYRNSSVMQFVANLAVTEDLVEELNRWAFRNRELITAKHCLLYTVMVSKHHAKVSGKKFRLPAELWELVCFDFLLHVAPLGEKRPVAGTGKKTKKKP